MSLYGAVADLLDPQRDPWLTDPAGWVRHRLGEQTWSKQDQVLASVRDHRRTAVHSAHGVGKSWLAARVASWWIECHPPGTAFVVSTAPSWPQVRAILWRYIGKVHRDAKLRGRVNQTEWWLGDEMVGYGRKPADTDEEGFQGIHCLDEEHEILTRRGWLGIDEMTLADEVLSVPVDSDVAEWMPVTQVHRHRHRGHINVYDGRLMNFAVTDEHRFLQKYDTRDQGWSLRPLNEMPSRFTARRVAGWKGEGSLVPEPFGAMGWDMERFAAFVGFWIGDGGLRIHHATQRFYEVLLYQTKPEGLAYLGELLDGVRTYKGSDYIGISDRPLAAWLKDNVGRYGHDRVVPRQIVDGTPEVIEAFLDGLWRAEGSHLPNGERRMVYNTSRRLMDQVQEMLLKLGRPSTMGTNGQVGRLVNAPQGKVKAGREVFCLSWIRRPADHVVRTERIRREPYDGRVWCVSTPHETFYTRRKGKVFLSGNSQYLLVLVDEAAGIPTPLWTAILALLTTAECRVLAIGNPDYQGSHFSRMCQPGSGWNVIHIDGMETPNFTGEPLPRGAPLLDQTWIDDLIVDYGADSPQYTAKVRGLFPADKSTGIIPWSWAHRCRGVEATARVGPLRVPVHLGVDVGGGGDLTVIRERQGPTVGGRWVENTDDSEVIVDRVLTVIRDTGATEVKVDFGGIGFGVVGSLRRRVATEVRHPVTIHAVNFGATAKDNEKYLNVRAELWWEGRLRSTDGNPWDLTGADERTMADLTEPQWFETSDGRIQVEAKDQVRKRLGRSPDDGDAVLLAFYDPPTGVAAVTAASSDGMGFTGR